MLKSARDAAGRATAAESSSETIYEVSGGKRLTHEQINANVQELKAEAEQKLASDFCGTPQQ